MLLPLFLFVVVAAIVVVVVVVVCLEKVRLKILLPMSPTISRRKFIFANP